MSADTVRMCDEIDALRAENDLLRSLLRSALADQATGEKGTGEKGCKSVMFRGAFTGRVVTCGVCDWCRDVSLSVSR